MPEWEHILECSNAQRKIRPDELGSISKSITSQWRSLGKELHFTDAQLDEISEEKSDSPLRDRAQLMLLFWINWQCESSGADQSTPQTPAG